MGYEIGFAEPSRGGVATAFTSSAKFRPPRQSRMSVGPTLMAAPQGETRYSSATLITGALES